MILMQTGITMLSLKRIKIDLVSSLIICELQTSYVYCNVITLFGYPEIFSFCFPLSVVQSRLKCSPSGDFLLVLVFHVRNACFPFLSSHAVKIFHLSRLNPTTTSLCNLSTLNCFSEFRCESISTWTNNFQLLFGKCFAVIEL